MPRPDQILASEHQWLRRLARRLARSPGSADDLVQDTCVTVLDKPAPTGEMRPWLRAIMRNLARGEVRGGVRRGQREDRYRRMAPAATEPDPLIAYGVDRARLQASVERLPEPFRSTVVQRFVDGSSCAEIARAEGVPAGTVRWRQSRALELLRAELERPSPRRRRRLWLPFLGLEGLATVGRRLARTPVGAGAAIALVGALLLLAVVPAADRGRGERAAPVVRPSLASAAVPRPATSRPDLAAVRGALEGPETGGAPRGPDDPEPTGPAPGASRSEREALLHPAELEALRGAFERALYDCRVERGVLACVRTAVDPRRADGGTCVVLERSLGFLARARRGELPALPPLSLAFLEAAGLANQALVAALGCVIAPDLEDDEPAEGARGGGRARPEPSCTSGEDSDGQHCTSCTDTEGRSGTACAPVVCETTTGPDGRACTTCTDAAGQEVTECEGGAATECDSEIREYGLLCSTCPGGSAAAPECRVAMCWSWDGCLECTDGLGRTARDCATSLDGTATTGSTWSGGDFLRTTSAWWGGPGGAGSAVQYAGASTCSAGSCLHCGFADGSSMGVCPYEGDLEADLRQGRPADLPAPGGCTTARRVGGVECTTCTRGDLSASTLCRFPPAVSCDETTDGCVTCELVGGGTASSCHGDRP